MKRLSPKLIITSIIVALWSFFSSLLIAPANRHREALDSDTHQKRTAADALSRAAIEPREFTGRAEELKTAIAGVEQRLEPDGQNKTLIEDVWRLAEANSLETRTIRAPGDGSPTARLSISLTGNFAGFYQFLTQIEQMPRLVRIDRLQLARTDAADGQVQADVSLQVFLQPTTATTASKSAAVADRRRSSSAMPVEWVEKCESDCRQWRATLAESDAAIERLQRNSAAMQTSLTDLKGNPFVPTGALTPEDPGVAGAGARRREEQQRQDAMRSVQALQLTSIINGASRRACLINNSLYQEGQEADGFSIEEITPSAVVVRRGIYRFELRVNR